VDDGRGIGRPFVPIAGWLTGVSAIAPSAAGDALDHLHWWGQRRGGWRRYWAVPLGVWTAIAAFEYRSFLTDPTRSLPGGPDGVLYSWYFRSTLYALTHLHNPLISDRMNAPGGVSLMWNTSVPLLSISLAPVTWLIGATATTGLLMTVSPILAACSVYFVLRRFKGATGGAFVGATLYGFGPFAAGQSGHLHLVGFMPFVPLLVYFGVGVCVAGSAGEGARRGLALGVVCGAAVLVSEEMLAMSAIVAVIAVAAGVVVYAPRVAAAYRRLLAGAAAAVAAAVAVAGLPLFDQFYGPLHLDGGVGLYQQSVDVASILRPGPTMWFASASDVAASHVYRANTVESTGYLGWPLIAVVMLGITVVIMRSWRIGWVLAVSIAAAVALSFGAAIRIDGVWTGAYGPWNILNGSSLLRSATPARFSLITVLLASFIIALALAAVRRRRLVYSIGLATVLLGVLPLIPRLPYRTPAPLATPRFFTTAAVTAIRRDSVVLVLPQTPSPFSTTLIMRWQIDANLRFKIIGGYSVFNRGGASNYFGYLPPFATLIQTAGQTGTLPAPSEIHADAAAVQSSHIRYVVLTDYLPHESTAAQVAREVTGCTNHQISDVLLCAVPAGPRRG
jgi:hypothetical protein